MSTVLFKLIFVLNLYPFGKSDFNKFLKYEETINKNLLTSIFINNELIVIVKG
jgi:hypothetical protein